MKQVLVIFGEYLPRRCISTSKFDTVVASKINKEAIIAFGCNFIDIENLIGNESIYKANNFLEELSILNLPDGRRLTKSFIYKGYELWWIHYSSIFINFCLPYTKCKKLLEYLKDFSCVSFYKPPYEGLFYCYLQAHGCKIYILKNYELKLPAFLPFGVFMQILITFLSLPILMIRKYRIALYTGDTFDENKDYDFRMKYIYGELRDRNLKFVEFIRSLESWRTVVKHAMKRKRPVIYTDAVYLIGRFLSFIFCCHWRARKRFDVQTFNNISNYESKFKYLVATYYLFHIYDDIWTIRIMKFILSIIGVKSAYISYATDRTFHTVLGCKLNTIPTVGILHGVASRYATPSDFMRGFDGEKMLSVDVYGIWSEWWKEYYIRYSRVYKPEQLFVSGPMRPLETQKKADGEIVLKKEHTRVLFIAEQAAIPSEVMPYLYALINQKDVQLIIKFRPYRDTFEEWLKKNDPQVLKLQHIQIAKGNIQDAIQKSDVVVGCHSTGVLEALLQLRVPIFLRTQKWGDYYGVTESDETRCLFAETPKELVEKIKQASTISRNLLTKLSERYFGDPYKNGSKWVVDMIEGLL